MTKIKITTTCVPGTHRELKLLYYLPDMPNEMLEATCMIPSGSILAGIQSLDVAPDASCSIGIDNDQGL